MRPFGTALARVGRGARRIDGRNQAHARALRWVAKFARNNAEPRTHSHIVLDDLIRTPLGPVLVLQGQVVHRPPSPAHVAKMLSVAQRIFRDDLGYDPELAAELALWMVLGKPAEA